MFRFLKRLLKPPPGDGPYRAPRGKSGLTKPKEREDMLWVGDGMAPAGPHLLGLPVDINGRKGKVVGHTLLTITVEWED